jgi:hypothetical protein
MQAGKTMERARRKERVCRRVRVKKNRETCYRSQTERKIASRKKSLGLCNGPSHWLAAIEMTIITNPQTSAA